MRNALFLALLWGLAAQAREPMKNPTPEDLAWRKLLDQSLANTRADSEKFREALGLTGLKERKAVHRAYWDARWGIEAAYDGLAQARIAASDLAGAEEVRREERAELDRLDLEMKKRGEVEFLKRDSAFAAVDESRAQHGLERIRGARAIHPGGETAEKVRTSFQERYEQLAAESRKREAENRALVEQAPDLTPKEFQGKLDTLQEQRFEARQEKHEAIARGIRKGEGDYARATPQERAKIAAQVDDGIAQMKEGRKLGEANQALSEKTSAAWKYRDDRDRYWKDKIAYDEQIGDLEQKKRDQESWMREKTANTEAITEAGRAQTYETQRQMELLSRRLAQQHREARAQAAEIQRKVSRIRAR